MYFLFLFSAPSSWLSKSAFCFCCIRGLDFWSQKVFLTLAFTSCVNLDKLLDHVQALWKMRILLLLLELTTVNSKIERKVLGVIPISFHRQLLQISWVSFLSQYFTFSAVVEVCFPSVWKRVKLIIYTAQMTPPFPHRNAESIFVLNFDKFLCVYLDRWCETWDIFGLPLSFKLIT